jgi:hypothetical protein
VIASAIDYFGYFVSIELLQQGVEGFTVRNREVNDNFAVFLLRGDACQIRSGCFWG